MVKRNTYNFNLLDLVISDLRYSKSPSRELIFLESQKNNTKNNYNITDDYCKTISRCFHLIDLGRTAESQLVLSTICEGLFGIVSSKILALSLLRDAPKTAQMLLASAESGVTGPEVMTRARVYDLRDRAVVAVHAGNYELSYRCFLEVNRYLSIYRLPAREQLLFCLSVIRGNKILAYSIVEKITINLIKCTEFPVIEALFLRFEMVLWSEVRIQKNTDKSDLLEKMMREIKNLQRDYEKRISYSEVKKITKGLNLLILFVLSYDGSFYESDFDNARLLRIKDVESAEALGCVIDIEILETCDSAIRVVMPDGFELEIKNHPLSDNFERQNRFITLREVELADDDSIITSQGHTTEWLLGVKARPFDTLRTDRRVTGRPSLNMGPPGYAFGYISPVSRKVEVPCAMLYRSRNQWSWFGHWVIDSLTRVAIIEATGGWDRFHYPCPPTMDLFQRESLEFFDFPIDRLLPKKANECWHMASLSVIDFGPTPPFRYLQELTGNRLGARQVGTGNRIYVSRRYVPRRHIVNEEEVEAFLSERYGFEIVYPERLAISEQIRLFHGADVIAGPIGSALCSVVFARPGASLVQIFTGLHVFSSPDLFRDLGIKLYVMSADPVEAGLVWHDAVLRVDIQHLSRLIDQTIR